jgi:purine-nucleoside phosphorylase
VLGDWAGRRTLVFQGRLHYYEGHSWEGVVGPIHAAHALGARVLILTNAAGGIHDALVPGSLMAIRDHIEWTRPGCWKIPGPGGLGPARPSPYSPRLVELLEEAAHALGMDLLRGVYASVTGPSYETPAEIRALKAWGADAVGMSTAREAQAGYELGMECAALSCITNRAAGLAAGAIHHGEVLTTATSQIPRLVELLERFFVGLDEQEAK